MLGQLLRVLIGFAVACLGAGLTMVLFVLTPSELSGLPPDVASDRAGKGFELAAFVAVQAALFSAPFALVVAAVGEALKNRSWSFYALAGILISVVGFLAQHSTEQPGQPTIVNNYALTAFVTAGFVAGLLFWLFSGRSAGGSNSATVEPSVAKPVTAPQAQLKATASVDQPKPPEPTSAASGNPEPEKA